MNEKTTDKRDVVEIDLKQVIPAILNKSWLIVLTAVLCAVIAFFVTFFFITPKYQASAMFYVNNSSLSVGDASVSISSGDLVTSRNLVDSYIVILNTRETLLDVIDYGDINRSFSEVRKMISAAAVNETEIFRVSVTSTDPVEAEQIANAIAHILPKRIGTIIDGTSAKVVDAAVVPSAPFSPSYFKNTVVGFLIGFVAMVAIIMLREIMDITIRSEEDVTQCCSQHPILAAVPDMTAPSKGSYYYSSEGKKSKRRKTGAYVTNSSASRRTELIGSGISFAAAEAYKLLRTKLQFSFADNNGSRVIGLSSALSGEGKSLTSSNLAFTLAQLDKKVILIDCDMRRPTLAEKLGVLKNPGLSIYLTGQCALEDIVQQYDVRDGERTFHVISAGENPPNPVELLSSARMQGALQILRKYYDYIILDLPPVGEVTDALAVAKETDGMLLVVRQNYCDRIVLNAAVRQFEFISTKILGLVVNCTVESAGGYNKSYYKRYSKYSKYNKKYDKYYSRAYEPRNHAQETADGGDN